MATDNLVTRVKLVVNKDGYVVAIKVKKKYKVKWFKEK